MTVNDDPRIFGYAAPAGESVPPVREQLAAIGQKAKTIEGGWGGCRVERFEDAHLPWNERPEFQRLRTKDLRPGDALIVYHLSCFGRHPFAMQPALQDLVKRGIDLHMLDLQGHEFRVNQTVGPLVVALLGALTGLMREMWSSTSKQAQQRRKDRGLAVGPLPGYGKKRIRTKDGAFDMWDAAQCNLIREVHHRHHAAGESVASIARDFYARKVKTGGGRLWVTVRRRRGKVAYRANRLYKVLAWYERLLAGGGKLKA